MTPCLCKRRRSLSSAIEGWLDEVLREFKQSKQVQKSS